MKAKNEGISKQQLSSLVTKVEPNMIAPVIPLKKVQKEEVK